MDLEVRAAMRTIARAGLPALDEMLELFPVLRHTRDPGSRFGFDERRYWLEREDEWEKWTKLMPVIHFPEEWEVKMRPPSVGAIVRFVANDISVYLDCYGRLGMFNGPYWELYPSETGDTERFAMNDVDGLLDGLRRAHESSRGEEVTT